MRLWLVPTHLLCRQHLLGEHNECHMFVGTLNKGRSIRGYLHNDLLEIHSLEHRHNELAAEMIHRGYNHNSPLPPFVFRIEGLINVSENLEELKRRCPECRKRINGAEKEHNVQQALGLRSSIDWEKYYPQNELCPICKQPDSCGDCDHTIMTGKEAEPLLPTKVLIKLLEDEDNYIKYKAVLNINNRGEV